MQWLKYRTNGTKALLALGVGLLLGVALFFVGLGVKLPVEAILLWSIIAWAALVCVLIADVAIRGDIVVDISDLWFWGMMAAICLFGLVLGFAGTLNIASPFGVS